MIRRASVMALALITRLNWNGPVLRTTAAMTLSTPHKKPLSRTDFLSNRMSISATPNGTVTTSNPTLGWKGVTHSTSPHVRHVLIEHDGGIDTIKAIDESLTSIDTNLNATQLLELGSVWYLPAAASKDPSLGQKPLRLSFTNPKIPFPETLAGGDYLRIHGQPRRYLEVHRHDWNVSTSPLVVGRGNGWLVINKPANIPVHPTVDNEQENVASCLLQANCDVFDYVSTPQRLDVNTSGLIVVATSKAFAGYFAQLLRFKTQTVLNNSTSAPENNTNSSAIHKRYRCWVRRGSCDNNPSEVSSSSILQPNQILRHYLEPSISAPKRFLATPPANSTVDWLECLLRIVSVQEIEKDLSWELDIELLTGRTHQIRGQMAAVGLPIVGDALYNGTTGYHDSPLLSLQCQALEFIDPEWEPSTTPPPSWRLSKRWNRFALPEPPWRKAMTVRKSLPPRVDLATGRHKYVLVHAEGADSPGLFVKSASAEDCGGIHHGHVAQELRAWIAAAGFLANVIGGGWIDHEPERRRIFIFGTSHGFGRADHAVTARHIRAAYPNYEVTHDDGLL